MAAILNSLQASASGNITTISLAIPEQQLEQLVNSAPHGQPRARTRKGTRSTCFLLKNAFAVALTNSRSFHCATRNGMLVSAVSAKDDRLTVIAIAALACILQDVLHEGLGHGVTAWLSGAHRLTVSTVALQCDIDTRWISANGTLVNLLLAAIFWLLLLRPQSYRPSTRYFLVLAMAGNLFTGTGSRAGRARQARDGGSGQ